LGGKPLLAYTTEAALRSKLERVVVSTEDPEIAKIAKECGVEVPFLRPPELASDEAPMVPVVKHTVDFLERAGFSPEVVAILPPTSPFRTERYINAGIDLLLTSDVDSVVGVCQVEPWCHPYYVYEMRPDGRLLEVIELPEKPHRSQELPKLYRLNDSLILSRRQYFENVRGTSPCFNPRSMKGLVMDRVSSITIDEEFDFLLAEFVMKSGLLLKR
jgi:CMP-N-acetylneuraminic acid synthetase